MRKQCLMFMLLLAASEHAEKNPLEKNIFERILSSRKSLFFGPSPDQLPCCRTSVICRITTYFTSHAPLRPGCVHLSRDKLR